MDVGLRCRILSLGSSALLLVACARDHSDALSPMVKAEAGEGVAGRAAEAAAEGGKAGPATKPRDQPKPGKAGVPGTKAVASFDPIGDAAQDPENALGGSATFNVTDTGVDVSTLAQQCPANGQIDLFIQEGGDCSEETLSGPHWDGQRGEGIPRITCLGVSMQGRGAFTRRNDAPNPWSIGGSEQTDLLMHALVAYDASSGAPLACGVIMLDEDAAPPPESAPDTSGVPLIGRAQIAGLCFGGLVRTNEQQCPDPKELTACAQEHCQLDACVAMCSDYLACTTKETDPCSVAYTCPIGEACSTCIGAMQQCTFSFCTDQISCAAPVKPDGPCSQLEACCALQGDKADSCLQTVRLLEGLSGDPSCHGAMQDWDFFSHLPVPCMFE